MFPYKLNAFKSGLLTQKRNFFRVTFSGNNPSISHFFCGRGGTWTLLKQTKPLRRGWLFSLKTKMEHSPLTNTTEANVSVGIGCCIVEIHRECSRIYSIVPIRTTKQRVCFVG